MRNYFQRMFGPKEKGFVFTTRNIARSTGNGDRITSSGAPSYDSFFSISDTISASAVEAWGAISTNPGVSTQKVDTRKAVEPKAVFDEIKKETPEISFDRLDEKIAVVTQRIDILKEHLGETHLGDEQRTLFFLKNRKKYLSTMAKNPLDWAMTTQDAIEDLCKTYKLKVVPLKQYYTLVPNEGVKEMERYTKAYKSITGDLPIFELVIKDTQVKEQKKKDRDPILLANSPLGNFLFVLGAWDEEVEFVDEIIYNGK